jgi:hypothetical protein
MMCILNDKMYLKIDILATVITLCETITKCACVGLRVASEFDFTRVHFWCDT